VFGESTLTWVFEVRYEDEEHDHRDAERAAVEIVQDMLQLEPFGEVKITTITGQSDRVMRCIELAPLEEACGNPEA